MKLCKITSKRQNPQKKKKARKNEGKNAEEGIGEQFYLYKTSL